MIRTFNDWLNGIESFALRSERAYDDLTSVPKDTVDHWSKIVVPWLKSAFDAGYEAGEINQQFLIQSLKNEIRTQRLEIAGLREERINLIDKDYPPGYHKYC
jgi:hypothetical protein